jgi:hypothetical protein
MQPSRPLRLRAWRPATAAVLACALGACLSPPIDPTENVPVRACEERRVIDSPPAALVEKPSELPIDERAPHAATRLVISQLSRVERLANAPVLIDVRLDAFDATGAPAPLAGDLRIVVKSAAADPCYLAFDVPMASKRQVARRFDQTLRQYVIRLEPAWEREPVRGSDLELKATLLVQDGSVIEAEARLLW